ncbi:MAG: hypothetical protein C0467_32735 [Planctomycetaceae bacterium]|nr:hypothetical protein [Planctomycetaceae bacterium]
MPTDARTDRELLLEIIDRLQRLEVRVLTPRREAVDPLRVSSKQASKLLGVSTRTIRSYRSQGLLVPLPRVKGTARNAVVFFDPANVAALAQSEDHAREWVARRKYVPIAKRSRG